MSKGEHSNAANIFLSLAERARDLGIMQPASMLFLQSAHAYILAGEVDSAVENAHIGLSMLADADNWPDLRHQAERISELMSAEGFSNQVADMKAWLEKKIKEAPADVTTQHDQKSASTIPEKCPYCGATMSLDQINAAGAKAAECRYCGSVVLPIQSTQ
jgi:aconitase A